MNTTDTNTWGLELCPVCNQMTNHDDDGCLKCRATATDTNQASEDELYDTKAWKDGFQSGYDQVIDEMLYWLAETERKTIPSKWVTSRQTDMHSKQHEKLTALIRTEQKKLLVAVRERVVGEDEATNTSETEIDSYEAFKRNELRQEQRIELTKLEAEL